MQRKAVRLFLALFLTVSLIVPPSTFGKGGGGFGGGRSFGGGARSAGFSGRSFSTPRTVPAPSRGTFKPSGGFSTRYDNAAASAQRAHSSRSLYERTNGIFNGGRTTAAERVGPVTQEAIDTRPAREASVFRRYYTTQPIPVVYHDSFNPWFWLWLMDRGQHDRDLWIYNHRDEMDDARYHDLLQKDADLERRLHDIQQQGVTPDSSYTPPGVDQDLMYNDDEVKQAYNEGTTHPQWGLFGASLTAIGLAYLIFFVPMFRRRRRIY
jgi:hypothetical protein